MSVSLIVPTLHEEKYLGALLDSVARQLPPVPCEVIVVDASRDTRTADAAALHRRNLDLHLVKTSVADVGAQRNIGAARARYRILLFVDADVVLDGDVLERCLSRIGDKRLAVLSVRHRADQQSLTIAITLLAIDTLIALARMLGKPVTNGDFLMTTRETFERVGGFAEGYLLGEDTHLATARPKRAPSAS